jgi:lysine 6-dehydrogenase
MRRGGRNLAVDPLAPSETERLVDPDVGELEAFPSDGLRTLLQSFPGCPEMAELTLRYPGHLAFMRRRAAAGAFDGGVPGRSPLEASAAELAEKFSGEKFPDVLIMEVRAAHQGRSVNWRLVDRRRGGQSAMARTTAFTAAAAACALASGGFDGVGCLPPEALGRTEGIGKKVLSDLKARDIELVRGAKLAAATPRPHGRA